MMLVRLSSLRVIIQEILLADAKKCAGEFAVGDHILFGKWKNKRGKIIDVYLDDRGHATIDIEPVPKGRKKDVTMGLYKVWKPDEAFDETPDAD